MLFFCRTRNKLPCFDIRQWFGCFFFPKHVKFLPVFYSSTKTKQPCSQGLSCNIDIILSCRKLLRFWTPTWPPCYSPFLSCSKPLFQSEAKRKAIDMQMIFIFMQIKLIIIRNKVFFLFIGWEPTTWSANNCLQIMVCLCAMWSNYVWLQIIFWSCVKETTLFSFFRSLLRENGSFPKIFIKKQTRGLNVRKIIELGYCRRITIICSTSSNNC